jgi:hypothetical protein
VADDPRQPGRDEDRWGYGQQPLHRTDATTGDEGIGDPSQPLPGNPEGPAGPMGGEDANQQVHGGPAAPRREDAQE